MSAAEFSVQTIEGRCKRSKVNHRHLKSKITSQTAAADDGRACQKTEDRHRRLG